MKRLLLLGALAAAVLVPVAAASPAATHTLRGTVVAKDRAHHALVVALPGGTVQTLVAPAAFGRTDIGRKVVIRYTGLTGRLPVALGVSLRGHASHALVRGTIVRLVKRQAIVNAGGSVLNVTLTAPKKQRALASATAEPQAQVQVGDTVKIEVGIDANGSLAAGAVVATAVPAVQQVGSEGEMEVRGKVAPGLSQASSTVAGSITVQTSAANVMCVIPKGTTLAVNVGDMIELKCDLIGATWTVRAAHGEDDHAGGGNSSEIKVRGTIAVLTDATTVGLGTLTVKPEQGGDPVSCTIPSSVMAQLKAQFAVNDVVKLECVMVGTTLTLKEIEKKGGGSGGQSSSGQSSSGQSGDDDDDDESSDD